MVEYSQDALRDMARQQAVRAGVDPDLFIRLINQESRFNPTAVSGVGAQGLGQVMPDTARSPGYGVRPLASEDLMDPQENLRFSADYLKAMLREFEGDVPLALAAYNAGAGSVQEYGGVPPFKETQEYVQIIGGDYQGSGYASEPTDEARRAQYGLGDRDPGNTSDVLQAVKRGDMTKDEAGKYVSEELLEGIEGASAYDLLQDEKAEQERAMGMLGQGLEAVAQDTRPSAPTPRSLPLRLSRDRTSATPGTQAIGRFGLESLLRGNPLLGIR